jgi:hypothetical protein
LFQSEKVTLWTKSRFAILALLFFGTTILTGCGGGGAGGGTGGGATKGSIPAAPASVAINSGDRQVAVTWAPSDGATSYNIYYSLTPGTVKTGIKVINAVSPRTIAGLTNGTTYYFVVTAVNAYGESVESGVKAVMPLATPPPAAPQTVQAAAGAGTATVTWNTVTGATSYTVYYGTASGVTKTTGTKLSNATSPQGVPGLANNTTYYFVVTATNTNGESAESFEVSATPVPVGSPPSTPAGVQASPGNGQATVSWGSVTGATSYTIYYASATGVTKATGTKLSNAISPANVPGLTNDGTTYYFVVTASNANGESTESVEVSARPATAVNLLRVLVLNVTNTNKPISGARVALGNSAGAFVASAVTDAQGEVYFSYPPASATVTAAMKTTQLSPVTYSLKTLYDVNVTAVTLDLNLPDSDGQIATVTVTDSLNAASWDIFPGYVAGDAVNNPALSSIFTSDVQSTGNVSFVAIGYDAAGKAIGYGTNELPYTGGVMTVALPLDKTDITSAALTIDHIPASAANGKTTAYLTVFRNGGSGYTTSAQGLISSPSPTILTLSVPAVPGFGDDFTYTGQVSLGTTNTYYGFQKTTTTPGNQVFDLNTYPAIPGDPAIADAGSARPVLSWTGNDTSASSMWGEFRYDGAASAYTYSFEAPASRTSVVFPELPAAMAEYIPTWISGFTAKNSSNNLATGYDESLTAFDQYLHGTLTPAVFLRWWSGNGM